MLARRPEYNARLEQIRRDVLACCGAQEGKGGRIELIVVDRDTYTKLQQEREAIEAKLAALDALVIKLDEIFSDAAKEGFDITQLTPAALDGWRRGAAKQPRGPWDP
jgi:hypothetical protein